MQNRMSVVVITLAILCGLPACAQPIPIPNLSKWESQMIQYATPNCNEAAIKKALGARPDESNVWYYDGMRVFQQIAQYTNNPDWYRCAEYVAVAYQSYVIGARTPGWRVFPKGLHDHFVRTGDLRSLQGVVDLATKSAFANSATDPAWSDSWEYSREMAYIMDAYVYHHNLGSDHPLIPVALGDIFGHFDQWFVSKTSGIVKPFMVGLSAEALIEYYTHVSPDPRILTTLQLAADWMWDRAWVPSARAFQYGVCRQSKYNKECNQGPSPDLNMLIAPMYAWLYMKTGDVKYQERGDAIFSGGVDLAYLGSGKHFSQNYRWSFAYVTWRQSR